MKREATALIGVPIVLAVILFVPWWGFSAIAALVITLAGAEVCAIAVKPSLATPILFLSLPLMWGWMGVVLFHLPLMPMLLANAFLPAIAVLLTRGEIEQRYASHTLLVVIPLMIGLPGGFLISLPKHFGSKDGIALIFLLLATVWIGDSAAYYMGKQFGKRKVSPHVSPNKTIFGSAALVITALILTHIWNLIFLHSHAWVLLTLTGIVIGLAAFLGDLIQSLWKRALGVKDSGSIFPGHGGFWDRIDSLLWAAVVIYFAMGVLCRG